MAIVSKEDLAKCFRDTKHFYEEDFTLSEAVADTNRRTKVYAEDFNEEVNVTKEGMLQVIEGRTLRTALKLHAEYPNKKIAVLNFAASRHQGGGVLNGSHAQEESICRSSTLYPSLMTQNAYEGFYEYHDVNNCGWRASDRCIYSPDVVICKDDSDDVPQRLNPNEFAKVDVITCAAPHIFPNVHIGDDALKVMHIRRAKNIMRVSAFNGVDILITGAFGCGAFKNPASIVSSAWHEALNEYREKFYLTAFVIYARNHPLKHKGGEDNLKIFRNGLGII